MALTSVIQLAFKHKKCKYIAIYEKSFGWVNVTKGETFAFDAESLIEANICFLIDNCYFTLGSSLLRLTIGVPIGVDPVSFIDNLLL